MSFLDIFKNKFLEMVTLADTSFLSIAQTLGIAFTVGLLIFLLYKACYRGVLYSHGFNVMLMMITMITAMIIVTISSNVVLSLGMVGALSIVRYRTAIKDPMDLVYIFWAVSEGIAIGANLYSVVIIGTAVIGLSLLLLTKFRTKKKTYLLVINYKEAAYPDVLKVLSRMKYTIRCKMTKKECTELTLEIRLRDSNTVFVNHLSNIEDVNNVSLVSYNVDYAQ